MMKMLKIAAVVGAALASLAAAPAAHAVIATNVQLSTTGTGVYNVTGINQFDWQSSGDLVTKNTLAGTAVVGGVATSLTSFSAWVAAANANLASATPGTNTTTISIFAHARLNDLLNSGGGSVAPANLNTTGTGSGFEITAALDAAEGVKMIAVNTLQFTTITGTYSFFFDTSPDSTVGTGASFTDGTKFLTGGVIGTSGTALIDPVTGKFSGNSLLVNTVTAYNSAFIQTDPLSNAPLVGTTFDTLLKLPNAPLEAAVGVGGVDGLVPPGGTGGTTVVTGDIVLKADANSQFTANPVPEPSTITLLGAGLIGLAARARRWRTA